MFSIDYIKFYKGCKYLKNLKTDTDYILKHKIDKNFYAPNICITAIVGQNGAGKSSLLDMIFRIINNLSYCLFNKVERSASDSLSYIKGIQADLAYMSNRKKGTVSVRDGIVGFEFDKIKCKFIIYGNNNDEFADYNDYTNLNFSQQKEIAKAFFYTIATNYSIQSFISQDYMGEESIYKSGGNGVENNISGTSWLNNLFHKNDGYLSPIVLNPFRDNGWINMNNEEHLTISRLEAILIEEDTEHSLLTEYNLDTIKFNWKPRLLQEKFTINDTREKRYPSKEEVEEYNRYVKHNINRKKYIENKDLEDFKEVALKKDTYAHIILYTFRCGITKTMSDLQIYIRMYIVYKVLSIAGKYPSYSGYKKAFGNINLTFERLPIESKDICIQRLQKLAISVKNDSSHIGLKLRQALNFVKKEKELNQKIINKRTGITYEEYAEALAIQTKGMAVKERMEWLPPGIFHAEIYLKHQKTGNKVTLSQLSSGERQLIYLISTLLYHAINLSSVPKNGTRVRYNKLNLVLDEVEICFHPEYQRQFIKKLIDSFQKIELNKIFDINILLTTHSPFILSDIPKDNILCLKDGIPIDAINQQTFCSNVYDILNNQFFMTKFVGDIATKKVNHIVDELNKYKKQPSNQEQNEYIKQIKELKKTIDLIGDRYIRTKLQKQITALLYSNPLEEEYEFLKERIIEIEAKLKNNDTNKI